MAEKELVQIVGSENVLEIPEALREYSGPSKFIPRSVVRPRSIEEIQGIVKWANETNTPLIPVSSGAPHYRGDTAPGKAGAVVVDMRKMNKIIRVNSPNRVAIIEPGVTFEELQIELKKHGLCAYMPLLPRKTKSVLASVLERDPITYPSHHWDSTDPMLCTEIVFGTGDKTRTGEAAGPDTLEQQWEIGKAQNSPFGPTQMDIQRLVSGAQGTIGIVTWMSLKCRLLSQVSKSFFVASKNIEPLISLCYQIVRTRLGGHTFIVNGTNLACLMGSNAQEIRELQKVLPPWILFISFEGYVVLPEEKVEYQAADLKEMAEANGLKPEGVINGVSADKLLSLLEHPSDRPYWKTKLRGDFKDIFFVTTLNKTAGYASEMFKLAQKYNCPQENLGVYIQPIVQGTSCHCEFNIYHNPKDANELEQTQKLVKNAAERFEKMGAFFSRPYGDWAKLAYLQSSDTVAIQNKVKQIFDPNNVLNPGKLCF